MSVSAKSSAEKDKMNEFSFSVKEERTPKLRMISSRLKIVADVGYCGATHVDISDFY